MDLLGAISLISQNFLHFPPEPPKKPIVVIFFKRASLSTLITFNEFHSRYLLATENNIFFNLTDKIYGIQNFL